MAALNWREEVYKDGAGRDTKTGAGRAGDGTELSSLYGHRDRDQETGGN